MLSETLYGDSRLIFGYCRPLRCRRDRIFPRIALFSLLVLCQHMQPIVIGQQQSACLVHADPSVRAMDGEELLLLLFGLHPGGVLQPVWIAGGAMRYGPGQRAVAGLLPGCRLCLRWSSRGLDPLVSFQQPVIPPLPLGPC